MSYHVKKNHVKNQKNQPKLLILIANLNSEFLLTACRIKQSFIRHAHRYVNVLKPVSDGPPGEALACEAAGVRTTPRPHSLAQHRALQGRQGAESSLRCGPHQPLDPSPL